MLWSLDNCAPEKDRETLYVGMSRAKSLLFLCGTREACERGKCLIWVDPRRNELS